jgi:Cu/Zn superoxide dismutase
VLFLTWSPCIVQHVGDLGNVVVGPDGRASFRLDDRQIKVTHTHVLVHKHTHTHTHIKASDIYLSELFLRLST